MTKKLKQEINEMILAKKLVGENKDEIYSNCKKLIENSDGYVDYIEYICNQLNY